MELRRPGRVEAEEAEWDRYGSDCFADFTVYVKIYAFFNLKEDFFLFRFSYVGDELTDGSSSFRAAAAAAEARSVAYGAPFFD